MEYIQMTLDDWVQMKQKLSQELIGVKQSFVRIGYVLRQIDDQRLYENDGYKSITEFAKAEYGLEASTTSRFISINREYSIDGYSEHLRQEDKPGKPRISRRNSDKVLFSFARGRERCDRNGHAVFLRPGVDFATTSSETTGISTSSTKLK